MKEDAEKYNSIFVGIVKLYRNKLMTEHGKSPSFGENITGIINYPWQFIFVHSDFPEIELIITFHIKKRPDLEFRFYESHNYQEMFKIIENGVLMDPLSKSVRLDHLEEGIASIIRDSRQYTILEVPSKNSILLGRSYPDDQFSIHLVYGSILNMSVAEIASRLVKETPLEDYDKEIPHEDPTKTIILKGLGSCTDPPIWIDTPGKKPFIEKVYGTLPWKASKIEFKVDDIGGMSSLICKNGFIAIGTQDTFKALTTLNTIIGAMMVVLDKPFNVIRENDLGSAEFKNGSSSISGGRFYTGHSIYSPTPLIVQKDKIQEIFKLASAVAKNPKLQTELILALETGAYVKNSEWKQAILMGWLFLEDIYIADIWSRLMLSKQMTDERISKLNRYDIDIKLEFLNISGKIDDNEYKFIRKLKGARNKTIHEGKIPDKSDVIACLGKILNILRTDLMNVTV